VTALRGDVRRMAGGKQPDSGKDEFQLAVSEGAADASHPT